MMLTFNFNTMFRLWKILQFAHILSDANHHNFMKLKEEELRCPPSQKEVLAEA